MKPLNPQLAAAVTQLVAEVERSQHCGADEHLAVGRLVVALGDASQLADLQLPVARVCQTFGPANRFREDSPEAVAANRLNNVFQEAIQHGS